MPPSTHIIVLLLLSGGILKHVSNKLLLLLLNWSKDVVYSYITIQEIFMAQFSTHWYLKYSQNYVDYAL